jgi:hypothetical protein
MAEVGEAVCVDGLATRVQRPRGWTNQKVLYDAKRHTHTALGLSVRRLAGSCHEHELVGLARLEGLRDVFRAAAALVGRWLHRIPLNEHQCGTAGVAGYPARLDVGSAHEID